MRTVPARVIALGLSFTFCAVIAPAMPPPRPGGGLPEAFLERRQEDPRAFTFRNALIGQVKRIQRVRAQAAASPMSEEAAAAAGGIAVEGNRLIPVLPVRFRNTSAEPYPVANLQRELFDGPFPTGTMRDYYLEVSYGRLTVTGTVHPWQTLPENDSFYQGEDFKDENDQLKPCYGMCPGARTGDLLKGALVANDGHINFGDIDNDGPDGDPNSGDDDGFADFVAFVHPEVGGECENAQSVRNIWSHRWTYQDWKGAPFVTNDARNGGGFIKVNDYVIVPALACDGQTMIQIGVFAHEFGHAFGLPDLYDTDDSDGDSEGVGNWCLMSAGSWGGDNVSPERPSHLSAWAKAELGWIFPALVTDKIEFKPAKITASEVAPLAYKIPISSTQYYLIENRQRDGFDQRLHGAGLLVWKINETVVAAGKSSNRVNADENNMGVQLVQADGLNELAGLGNRGDGGDVFAGLSNKRDFQNVSSPKSLGRTAVCGISDPDKSMSATLLVSSGNCPTVSATPSGTAPQSPESFSIEELQKAPETYLNRPLRLTGRLLNLGEYFKNRRIVLQDSEGNTIDVRSWLPLEAPPGSRGTTKTLASYLGKKIEVVGELERVSGDNEQTFILDIDSAQVVPPPL